MVFFNSNMILGMSVTNYTHLKVDAFVFNLKETR